MNKIIHHFRVQNFDAALRTSSIVLNEMTLLVEYLYKNKAYFDESSNPTDTTSIMNMLTLLLEAQENNDYVLIADIYEVQIIPFLTMLQEIIITKETFIFDEENYKLIISELENNDRILGSNLKSLTAPICTLDKGYFVEYSSCGLMTLALNDNGHKYYLHSNNCIQLEAFALANSWYSREQDKYIIYGLGFGYHINELYKIDSNIKIEVYESDINVIQLACAFSNISSIINNKNIKLIYDPDFMQLTDRIRIMDNNDKFVLHYPSIRNVKSLPIKEKLEDYFVQYSTINNQRHLLNGNFNSNILNYDGIVDELKPDFEGKDLYIIAAGPSLDKNYQQLKNLGDRSIILATGTVFRKLLNAGITPDYVIVTDPAPRVYAQIEGLETIQVPMLYLSTAFRGFAEKYQGNKFMICQSEYDKSEEYAEKNDFQLYRTGGSVSTTALDVGIKLGCKRIIFLGLDLAFTDNYVHATGTSRRDLANTDDLKQVEDIHGNMIYTSKNLDIYRKWIENRIAEVQGVEFIDATEGGAKIKGMEIKKLSEILS